jgi:hypothetical protein
MANIQVEENLIKAAQSANSLSQELKYIISAGDPLLAEFAMKLLQDAVLIEQRLQRARFKIQNNCAPRSPRTSSEEGIYQGRTAKVEAILPGTRLKWLKDKTKEHIQAGLGR